MAVLICTAVSTCVFTGTESCSALHSFGAGRVHTFLPVLTPRLDEVRTSYWFLSFHVLLLSILLVLSLPLLTTHSLRIKVWSRCGNTWSGQFSSSSPYHYFVDRWGATNSSDSPKVWQDHLSGRKSSPLARSTFPLSAPFSMLTFATSARASRNWGKSKNERFEFHVGCFDRYGDIFSLYVGRTPVVILNSYELIKSTFDRWTFLKNTSLPKVPNKSTSLKYPCCCSEQRTKSKNSIKLSIKMFRAEYSGRPGNFSGTFFQKGKTGGSWWFCWKNRWMFWFSGISTTDGKHWRDQRDFLSKHLAHLTG